MPSRKIRHEENAPWKWENFSYGRRVERMRNGMCAGRGEKNCRTLDLSRTLVERMLSSSLIKWKLPGDLIESMSILVLFARPERKFWRTVINRELAL